MWSGGSTGAEAAGGRVSSGADNPIPGNRVPQEFSCGGDLVAGGEAICEGNLRRQSVSAIYGGYSKSEDPKLKQTHGFQK